jgi:hypothetical protein
MNDEIRGLIGICADCVHLFAKVMTTEDEELCYFKCLISDEMCESVAEQCSHHYNKSGVSLFMSEQFRND